MNSAVRRKPEGHSDGFARQITDGKPFPSFFPMSRGKYEYNTAADPFELAAIKSLMARPSKKEIRCNLQGASKPVHRW
jgi:hypothetical protein